MAAINQETVSGSTTASTSFTLTSWTPAANDLVLVGVMMRTTTITPSVSGNGLTFTLVNSRVNDRAQGAVYVFRGMAASPTTGQITITLTGNAKPAWAQAVRYSGANTGGTNGSGAVDVSSTNSSGSGSGDVNMQASTTTLATNDLLAAFAISRTSPTFTVPGGQDVVSVNNTVGSGGDLIKAHTWEMTTTTAGSYTTGGNSSLSASADWAVVNVAIKAGSATQILSGGVTPSGGLTKQTIRPLTGAVTPAGSLVNRTIKALAGVVAPGGTLTKLVNRALAGTVASAGALTALRVITKLLAGVVAPGGTLAKQTGKALAGAIAPAGSLANRTIKALSGAVAPGGTLTKLLNRALAGAVASSGTVSKQAARVLTGTITPAGSLANRTIKALSGAVTPAGTLVKQAVRALGGAVTSSGTVFKQAGKNLAGTVASSGGLVRRTVKALRGTVIPAGAVALQSLSSVIKHVFRLAGSFITRHDLKGEVDS